MSNAGYIIWAISVVCAIAVLAHYTAQFNIEERKQEAFMMKACVDAGGQWQRSSWALVGRDCIRPTNP